MAGKWSVFHQWEEVCHCTTAAAIASSTKIWRGTLSIASISRRSVIPLAIIWDSTIRFLALSRLIIAVPNALKKYNKHDNKSPELADFPIFQYCNGIIIGQIQMEGGYGYMALGNSSIITSLNVMKIKVYGAYPVIVPPTRVHLVDIIPS